MDFTTLIGLAARILHYGFVLSAAKEVLGDRFGWGFVVDDVHNAIGGDRPVGRLRLFEK